MTGEIPFLLALCTLPLLVAIGWLISSIIRLARLTADEIDAAEGQGEC